MRLSFATPIHNIYMTLEDWIAPRYDNVQVEKDKPQEWLYGRSPRDLLIHLGETLREFVSPSIWIDCLLRQAAECGAGDFDVIVDDVRKPEEYDALKAAGAIFVRVIRPGMSPRKMDGALDGKFFHITLVNDGDVDEWRGMAPRVWDTVEGLVADMKARVKETTDG